ncbi:RraA family protein [Burkholderia anthina]|uniref:RraA family protein n=1 Tax=Burkholderia anthina TaxID=179879 RepID=UPI001CF3778D|nr:RraA family protein [Burkholderia anthina]MCA8094856.1 RraA family protein [Burkholderia anthina]
MNQDVLAKQVIRLRRLDCCAVSDAMDRLGIEGVVSGLTQLSGEGRIAGRVITVKLGTAEPPPGPPVHLGSKAIEAGSALDVIVVEQRTGVDAGSWGGLLTLGAKLRGIAGVIADGLVRDLDEALAYGFSVFARGTTARTARGRVVEMGTGVSVEIGGQRVEPGDFVIADRSATIFIRAAEIERVLEAAEKIVAKEQAMAKALLDGTPISQVMGGAYEYMLK